MCHNPFFLNCQLSLPKKTPAEAVTKNKRFLILTHNKKMASTAQPHQRLLETA